MPKAPCCARFVAFTITYVVSPFLLVPLLALAAPFYRFFAKFSFEWFQTRRFVTTRAAHKLNVERVQNQVKAWGSSGDGAGRPHRRRMCTAKPAWNSWSMRWINKKELTGIKVSHLNSVVDVDEVGRTVTVEPGLMMGQLTSILLPRGWTIPLVPEFETLTVGGVIAGTGVESNGTRVGFSGDTALEYEIVIADGSVLTCSAAENEDLFHAIPWSHGTLGFLTAIKFPLVPAKKYVRLEYHRTGDPSEVRRLLETEDHEFVEGIAFGPRAFVVTYGDMADGPPPERRAPNSPHTRINHINRWYKPFFYKHVESFLNKRARAPKSQSHDGAEAPMGAAPAPCPLAVDYIPLRDYYHRHTRAYFWTLSVPLPYFASRPFLALFGWILPFTDAKSFKRLQFCCVPSCLVSSFFETAASLNVNIQDFVLPLRLLEPTLSFVDATVGVYPLWLCPTRFFRKPGFAHIPLDGSAGDSELYVDVGIYGKGRKMHLDHVEATEKMEAFTIEHGGVQFLYADSYLSREDFRRMFDMSLYDQVRVKYGAIEAFPDVHDKVSKYARGLVKEPETV